MVDTTSGVGQFLGQGGMVVPAGVDDVDEADTAFDHPPGQQAVSREVFERVSRFAAAGQPFRFRSVDSVKCLDVFGFAGEVDEFGGGHLHPEGKLIAGNPAGDLRVAECGKTRGVDSREKVNPLALQLRWETLWVLEVEDRFALVAERNPSITGW